MQNRNTTKRHKTVNIQKKLALLAQHSRTILNPKKHIIHTI